VIIGVCLLTDISEELINDKVKLKKPNKRQIATKGSSHDIFTYKKYIDTQFKIHRIYNKVDSLASSDIPEHDLETALNKLDTTITEIMLAAERKCCKARHDTDWSVELHVQSLM
jgi:hypothetical protein